MTIASSIIVPGTDAELAKAAAGGDADAMESLLVKFEPLFMKLARTHARPADVDDVAQEIRTEAWQVIFRWVKKGCQGGLLPLLATVGRRMAIDCIRRQTAQRRGQPIPLNGHDRPEHIDPAADLEAADALAKIMASLSGATAQHAPLILALTVAGWRPGEIDRRYGWPRGKTKAAMSAIRKQLGQPKATTIEQIDCNSHDVVAVFPSARAAGRATGIPAENISAAARGDLWQAGGYLWRIRRAGAGTMLSGHDNDNP